MLISSLTASDNYKDSDILGLSFMFLVFMYVISKPHKNLEIRVLSHLFIHRKLKLWEVEALSEGFCH